MNKAVYYLSLLTIILFALFLFSHNKADVDIWGNVGFVSTTPWSNTYKYTNSFSFTDTQKPWINHEWLGEYMMNLIFRYTGDRGLIIWKIIMGFILLLLMSIRMRRNEPPATAFLLTILILSTAGYGFSTRPHLFTYVFFASILYLLSQELLNLKFLCALLMIMMPFWANIHGAFFIGFVLILVYSSGLLIKGFMGEKSAKKQGLILLTFMPLLFVLTLLNPYGLKLWSFIFQSAVFYRPYLSEWAYFNPLTDLADHIDFVVLTIIAAAGLIFSSKKIYLPMTLILIVSFIAAIVMRRNIPLFAITCAFVLPGHIDDITGNVIRKYSTKSISAAAAFILLILSAACVYFGAIHNKAPFRIVVPQDAFPVSAINFIKANDINGNLLTFSDWSEYCIWKLPGCKVFIDGRFDCAYDMETIRDYHNFIYLGTNWQNAVTNYPTDMLLVHVSNPVNLGMVKMTDWSAFIISDIAILYMKNSVHKETLDKIRSGKAIAPTSRQIEFFP